MVSNGPSTLPNMIQWHCLHFLVFLQSSVSWDKNAYEQKWSSLNLQQKRPYKFFWFKLYVSCKVFQTWSTTCTKRQQCMFLMEFTIKKFYFGFNRYLRKYPAMQLQKFHDPSKHKSVIISPNSIFFSTTTPSTTTDKSAAHGWLSTLTFKQ